MLFCRQVIRLLIYDAYFYLEFTMLRYFRASLKAANLPKIRFHDLRHTAASLMLNNGVYVLVASQRLGHAQPSITLDVYGHLMPSMQSEAAEILDTLITS